MIILSTARGVVKLVLAGGKGNKQLAHVEDSNGDGLLDLVCQVNTNELEIETGQTTAVLSGTTYGGEVISGQDSIQIVPNN